MIKEQAVIVKVDAHNIWVDKLNTNGCAGCQQKSSCSTQALSQLLEKKSLRLINSDDFKLGDKVIISIDENILINASLLMYLLPLLALFVGTFLTDAFIEDTTANKDIWILGSAVLSFALCLLGIKKISATRYANSISIKKF